MNAHVKATDCRAKYLLEMMHYFNRISIYINIMLLTIGALAMFISYGSLYESLNEHILLSKERYSGQYILALHFSDPISVYVFILCM